jgi:mono/diheme cytochrome c family protein
MGPRVPSRRGTALGSAALIGLALTACERPAPDPSGRQVFVRFCASCHGPNADGNGPLASSLKTPPADLRAIARRNGGRFDEAAVMAVIDGRRAVSAHGPRDMPVWGDVFVSELTANEAPRPHQTALLRAQLLTDYLATLQEP